MKINSLRFACFFCIYAVLTSVIVGAMDTAFAQSTVPSTNPSVLNGLFSPTAPERFFEEGKRKIQKETKILFNPQRYKSEVILKIDVDNSKIMEELEEKDLIFYFPQNKL
jgi:hypothetical protein